MFPSPYTQPTITDFNVGYGDNPWTVIATNQRMYYDPVLLNVYRLRSVFSAFTTFTADLAAVNAKQMTITTAFDVHPNIDPLGLRDMYMPASHVDTRSQVITFSRYGGKVAYDTYTPIITYWKTNPGGLNAIDAIVQDRLGQHMVDVMDLLARNAMLQTAFRFFPNGKTNIGQLNAADTVTTSILSDIHLGMQYRGVSYADTESGAVGTIVCITSPGVLYDIQQQTDPKDWLYPMAYADPSRLLRYEVGTYRSVRFVSTPKATLFNCGQIIYQTTVAQPINAGDGSPSTLVDGTYTVGQPAAAKYIQLASDADMSQFAVNDIVSIHIQRTSDFGVTNGVDFRDGTLHNRRIVAIDAANRRLSFDQPIMIDMTVNLGGGVYAYVTKAAHIHAMIFVGGNDGIIVGVGRPPRFYAPDPVDDFGMIRRFSWDAYMGYNQYNPNVLEVAFVTGSFRYSGPVQLQG